ncbi:MFS transporter [Candidatus Woesearchaeota archaeon]|nr:MFS transporter [Candidatus Woesearchaeota archaeon]
MAHFSYSFYILRAQSLGIALVMIPLVYLAFNIFYAGFAYQAGRISDRIGRKKMIIAGYLLFAFVSIGFAYATQQTIWFLFPLYGIFMAATDGVTRAYVSDLAPTHKRGTALGIYHTATGLAMLPAGLIAGFLWDFVSLDAPFLFSGAVALIAVLLLILFKK